MATFHSIQVLLLASASIAQADWVACHQRGSEAYLRGDYRSAEASFLEALTEAEKTETPIPYRVVTTLTNLAATYTHEGRFGDADATFDRLKPYLTNPPTDTNMIRLALESEVNRATLALRRGKLTEALDQFERLLPKSENALGSEDLAAAQICSYLATIYKDLAQFGRARGFAERSLAIREKMAGPDSLITSASLSVLSQVLEGSGDLAGAEEFCRRALSIRRSGGVNAEILAANLSDLATILKHRGNYAEAEKLFLEAGKIWSSQNHRPKFELALLSNNLGTLYQLQGNFKKAEQEYQRAISGMEEAAGSDSHTLSLVLGNLSSLYRAKRKWDKAEPLMERSLEIDRKSLGPVHPQVATDLSALAQIHLARKEYTSAEKLFQESISIYRSAVEPDDGLIADTSFGLAVVYQQWGKPELAVPLFQQTMKIWDARPTTDLARASALEAYSEALRRNLQFADAERVATFAMGIGVRAARLIQPKS